MQPIRGQGGVRGDGQGRGRPGERGGGRPGGCVVGHATNETFIPPEYLTLVMP